MCEKYLVEYAEYFTHHFKYPSRELCTLEMIFNKACEIFLTSLTCQWMGHAKPASWVSLNESGQRLRGSGHKPSASFFVTVQLQLKLHQKCLLCMYCPKLQMSTRKLQHTSKQNSCDFCLCTLVVFVEIYPKVHAPIVVQTKIAAERPTFYKKKKGCHKYIEQTCSTNHSQDKRGDDAFQDEHLCPTSEFFFTHPWKRMFSISVLTFLFACCFLVCRGWALIQPPDHPNHHPVSPATARTMLQFIQMCPNQTHCHWTRLLWQCLGCSVDIFSTFMFLEFNL